LRTASRKTIDDAAWERTFADAANDGGSIQIGLANTSIKR
jgi:hypothetical protein